MTKQTENPTVAELIFVVGGGSFVAYALIQAIHFVVTGGAA